jgi:hypothetical protein
VSLRRILLDDYAREYDATRHGGLEAVAGYHDASGQRHVVAINLHPDLDWRVIDIAPDWSATLVERLPGFDDRRTQAQTLARDYAEQWQRHLAGERPDPPVIRPLAMRMRYQPASKRT